jgi:hypothetical protein
MSVLQLESDQSKSVKLEAFRHVRSLSARIKRAARAAMPFAIGGGIGVFIPILHFVIVPGALIAMIVLVTREMTTHYSFRVENIACPHCATAYGETEYARLPKRIMCFNCRVSSTLSEVGSLEAN